MTLFERIIAGDMPSHVVYEDEAHIAILDIQPVHRGHTLVIPKHPYRNLLDMSEEAAAALFAVVKKVSTAVQRGTAADGINIIMNNEAAAGQVVFHAHIHVIPRIDGDRAIESPKHTLYKEGEADKTLERLRNSF